MALLIRRGTDAERTGKVFQEGELIYTTDTKEVYIGDGVTPGGKSVSTYSNAQAIQAIGAALQAGQHQNISFTFDADQINATVTLDGGLLNVVEDGDPELGGDLNLNGYGIFLSDSTKVIDGVTGNLYGNLTGDVTGNVTGDVTGNVSGNAGTVTNGVYTTGSYSNPSWIASLEGSKISGSVNSVTNGVYTNTQQSITGEKTFTQTIIGDIKGSVISTDGITTLVNAQTNTISATTIGATDLTVSGTLTVNGTTTSINTTTLEVADKNITIAKGALTPAAAAGAGITIEGANATITYDNVTDRLVINKTVQASALVGNVTGNVTGNVLGNVTGNLTGNVVGDVVGSVFADDSTKIVDGITGNLFGNLTGNVVGNVTGNLTGDVYNSGPFRVLEVGTTASNAIFTGNIRTTTIDAYDNSMVYVNDDATVNGRLTVTASTRAILGFYSPAGYVVATDVGGGNLVTNVGIAANRVGFNVPVQFGQYTTTQRDALGVTLTIESPDSGTVPEASWSGGQATVYFHNQENQVIDVGAQVTISGLAPSGYNGTYTADEVGYNYVKYTVADPGSNGVATNGTVVAPVRNGTVIYNTTLNQFQGYANNSWVALS